MFSEGIYRKATPGFNGLILESKFGEDPLVMF